MTAGESTAVQLDDRARELFRVLVEEHIREGCPVGSRRLARVAQLNLSAATVRNVMADLEEMGLVGSPHASAGRVPTPRGYRLFVDSLLHVKPLSRQEIAQLEARFDPALDVDGLVNLASNLLSGVTRLAGMVTLPKRERVALRQIEFIRLGERRVLVILIVNGREVQNRILTPARDFSVTELQQIAKVLNERFAGQELRVARQIIAQELQTMQADLDRLMHMAIELGQEALAEDPRPREEGLITAGEVHLMDYDELSDRDKLRRLFVAIAGKRDILHILDNCIEAGGVQIFIGQESGYWVLDDCSVITAPYEVGGEVVGVLGVIGPTRMAYDRVIPVVDVTAKILGAALNFGD